MLYYTFPATKQQYGGRAGLKMGDQHKGVPKVDLKDLMDGDIVSEEFIDDYKKVSSCSGNCSSCQDKCKQFFKPKQRFKVSLQEQNVVITAKLMRFDHIIFILSGKGGAGKSTLAIQLAYALAEHYDYKVNLFDADICGPSIPTLTFTQMADTNIFVENLGWDPIPLTDRIHLMSAGYLVGDKDTPIIVDGDGKEEFLREMLFNTNFEFCSSREREEGCKNVLIIDFPPGSSEEHLVMTALVRRCLMSDSMVRLSSSGVLSAGHVNSQDQSSIFGDIGGRLDGAINTHERHEAAKSLLAASAAAGTKRHLPTIYSLIISTPDEVCLSDVRREVLFCRTIGLAVRGLVQNMSGFVCPHCGTNTEIFVPLTGGCERLSAETGIPLLGSLPIDLSLCEAAEEGGSWQDYVSTHGRVGYDKFLEVVRLMLESNEKSV